MSIEEGMRLAKVFQSLLVAIGCHDGVSRHDSELCLLLDCDNETIAFSMIFGFKSMFQFPDLE